MLYNYTHFPFSKKVSLNNVIQQMLLLNLKVSLISNSTYERIECDGNRRVVL